jgi:hypothetical protein
MENNIEKEKQPVDIFFEHVGQMGVDIINKYVEHVNPYYNDGLHLERQVLAMYLFGMAGALPEEIVPDHFTARMGFSMILMSKLFRFPSYDANDFTKYLISTIRAKDQNDMNFIIINRGAHGYRAYKEGKIDSVIADIADIMNSLMESGAKSQYEEGKIDPLTEKLMDALGIENKKVE